MAKDDRNRVVCCFLCIIIVVAFWVGVCAAIAGVVG